VENFFDNKEQAWKEDSSWITVNFFNKKADVLENQLEKGLRLVVEYSLITFPKEGLNVRLRVNGKSFHILEKKAQMQDRMAGRNQGLSEEEVEYEDKEEAPF
jgi:single-stranded DNA-binding protein